MNKNVKNVVKMIIYYVLAGCEKQDIQQCREVIELQYDMVSNGGKDEYLDSLINIFPKDHVVQNLYKEISKNGIDEMILAYKGAADIFSKADEIDFAKIEEDYDVEKIADKLMNL